MPFIAENPLLLAEVDKVPKTPFGGTRGIYAGKDGFYSIDDKGNVDKMVTEKDVAETINNLNSLYYYGDINIKPSDSSLFDFTINEDGETATVNGKFNGYYYEFIGDAVIPYECKIENKTYQVTSVGYFMYSHITSVVIPRCVTNIGFSAFSYCEELTNVIMPDGLEIISNDAFMNCDKIKNITIPTSVTEIGHGVFGNTGGTLKNIYFKGTKAQWDAIEKNDTDNTEFLSATIHYDWCDGSSGSGGGSEEENVQSDWNETNETSDAFIKNKPIITIDCDDKMWSNWEKDSKNLQEAGFYKLINLPSSGVGEYVFLIVQNFNESYFTITQHAITQRDILYRWATDESGDWVWTDWDTLYADKIHKHSYNDLTDKPTIPVVDQLYNPTSVNAMSGVAMNGALRTKADKTPGLEFIKYDIIDMDMSTNINNAIGFNNAAYEARSKGAGVYVHYGSIFTWQRYFLITIHGSEDTNYFEQILVSTYFGTQRRYGHWEYDDIKWIQPWSGILTLSDVKSDINSANENPVSGKAVAEAIANLVGSAPDKLNTLEELADALKDNADIVDVLNVAISNKVDRSSHDGAVNMLLSELANKADVSELEDYATKEELDDKVDYAGLDGMQSDIANLIDKKADKSELKDATDRLSDVSDQVQTHDGLIHGLKDSLDNLLAPPIKEFPTTLSPNTSYNFGVVESLNTAFPSVANDGDVIYLTFMAGEANPPNITINFTEASDIDMEIVPNTGYEIYAKYNGSIWIVGYSEYTITDGDSV